MYLELFLFFVKLLIDLYYIFLYYFRFIYNSKMYKTDVCVIGCLIEVRLFVVLHIFSYSKDRQVFCEICIFKYSYIFIYIGR